MNVSKTAKIIVIAMFIAAICISLMTPILDTDFFWHLATGRWIVEHKELPKIDPFSYATSLRAQEDFYRAKIVMTQYWLANLLQFGIFSLAGFNGIIALRICTVLFTLLIVFAHMRKRGLNVLTIILLFIPFSITLIAAAGDRPNHMTFMFVALFMFLLDSLRRGEKKGYMLPLAFLVWANIHGGFILGAVIAVIFMVSEFCGKIISKDYAVNKKLMLVLLVVLMAGLINPNGYSVMYSMASETPDNIRPMIGENRSPLSYAMDNDYNSLIILLVSLTLALFYLVSRLFSGLTIRKNIPRYLHEIILIAFLSALSFRAVRYIPLFVVIVLPIISPLFSFKIQDVINRLSRFLLPELLIAAISLSVAYNSYGMTVMERPQISRYYPDDAVQFIKERQIKGRFYNFYDWGGYLIWEFYPEQAVFIDGRGLSIKTLLAAAAILDSPTDIIVEKPLYQAMFESYSVRHVLIPTVSSRGSFLPLVRALTDDPEWRLIFEGRDALIFSRDLIEPSYPKSNSYILALQKSLEMISRSPNSPFPYLTFAQANILLGRTNSAMNGLEIALKNRPALKGGRVEKALELLKEGKDISKDLF